MSKTLKVMAGVVVTLALVISPLAAVFTVSKTEAQDMGWTSSADPTLTKTIELSSNTQPTRGNIDCTNREYLRSTTNVNKTGCFADSDMGQMEVSGDAILMADSSYGVPVTINVPGEYGIGPVPNQALISSQTSAPILGSYLHFYTNFRSALTLHTGFDFSKWFTVDKPPSVTLTDSNNRPSVTNTSTLSYSSNGDWLVVDSPQSAFLRVNLATFSVLQFAQSLSNNGLDYSLHNASTAVSDDGRYIAVVSPQYYTFKVYDTLNCSGLSMDKYGVPIECPSRNYWSYVAGNLDKFSTITSVRFSNDDNINFDAVYNYNSSTDYDAARFTMTSPGGQMHAIDYLALGDSYISGQGTFQYKQGTDTDSNTCHLSTLSYPYIVGASLVNSYESVACSGAIIKDVINDRDDYKGQVQDGEMRKNRQVVPIFQNFSPGYLDQIAFVKRYSPRIVMLSIGGNDVGFSDIMKACVAPQLGDQTCFDSYSERLSLIKSVTALYSTLQETYQSILAADPGVQLYVVGYPQVAAEGNCALNVHLNPSEIQFSQQLIAYLDATIQHATGSAGARYVDIQNALVGHRLCEAKTSDIAINGVTAGNDGGPLGLKLIGSESFHPNTFGHQILAQKVMQATNNFKQLMPPADGSLSVIPTTDPLAQTLLQGYKTDGTSTNAAIYDSDLPSFVFRGSSMPVSVSGRQNNLQLNGTYTMVLHSDPLTLGTVTSDENGDINSSINIPAGTSPGFHTLHVYGQDLAGEQVDIYKVIYVAASADDYNGDGISNAQDSCLVTALSGQDADQDGIDDACDPDIGNASTSESGIYPTKAKLEGNTIHATNSGP
jgi:lysophospholipase L1-like esterase